MLEVQSINLVRSNQICLLVISPLYPTPKYSFHAGQCIMSTPRPRQNPPTAQTRGWVVIRETQPKTPRGTRDYPKKQKKLTDHFTLSYAVIFDYLIVSMA